MRDAMLSHLCANQLLSPHQHGFVFSKSCATNLLETLDIITFALSNRFDLIAVLLDFAKAFDKVDHELLLTKLKAYGFGPFITNWVRAFLLGRKQRVVLGMAKSSWCEVISGVPQGSVLGPLLFLVYINDMPEVVSHFCKLFADDTKLLAIIRDDSDKIALQKDLDALAKWSKEWRMCFNESKCKVMHFSRARLDTLNEGFCVDPSDPLLECDSNSRHSRYTMTDHHGVVHTLEETTVERDLGILVDNKLRWRNQIDLMCAKASSMLGCLRRTFIHWTPHTFKILYSTFVRPHLEY